jgi:uncharacterized repeat protein (TIGR03803 family)
MYLRLLIFLVTIAAITGHAQVYEKLYSFDDSGGILCTAGLVQGSNGILYGTTQLGGRSGLGTIFTVSSSGEISTLVSFTGANGSNPTAGVVQGADGALYGTTRTGGVNSRGTVFRVTPAGLLTTISPFPGTDAPSSPNAALVLGTDGNFYGTSSSGGTDDLGTIFKVTPAGLGSTVVHFKGTNGSRPMAGLFLANNGMFYGTTVQGGANNKGTIFAMTPAGTLTTLVSFDGVNGEAPAATLTAAPDGKLYGSTTKGGANNLGNVFSITLDGQFTVVADCVKETGGAIRGALLLGQDGNFYGTASSGGTAAKAFGTIFRLTTAGVFTRLRSFDGPNGETPESNLLAGIDGNLYGTTHTTVFSLSSTGDFKNVGGFPLRRGATASALTVGNDGLLWGTTRDGGTDDFGTIFKISANGTLTTVALLDETTGANPDSALTLAPDGNFYGTCTTGGEFNRGTVYKVSPDGVVTLLASFTPLDGVGPASRLLLASDGSFYGTTIMGGANDAGTMFRVTTAGQLTTVAHFTSTNGMKPLPGDLIQDTDNVIYGLLLQGGDQNRGAFYRLGAGPLITILNHFTVGNNRFPSGALIRSPDGLFYGTTSGGGNGGTVYTMSKEGVLTTVVDFTGPNGHTPIAGLIRGPGGDFFGTTRDGGLNNFGTAFRLTSAGQLTTIFDFANDASDRNPARSLTPLNGNLYGTANSSVYRLLSAGTPIVTLDDASDVDLTSATIVARVNPRGSATGTVLEYGTDGISFPNTKTLTPSLPAGFITSLVGATVDGLTSGATYFFRLRAVNASGETVTPVMQISTLAEPIAVTNPATEIAANTARFNGTVNAGGFSTNALFEWGTSGSSFPNRAVALPNPITGNTDVTVTAPLAGLAKGTTYFYRLRATNTAGIVVGGTQSFTTLVEPTAITGSAFALTTTTARVTGSVNPQNTATDVTFEYGTDGVNFPNSIAAAPAILTGTTLQEASAVLTNLMQGVTYFFRVKASSAGGIATSTPASFSMGVLSGFTQQAPASLPSAEGFLLVNLLPAGINSGWRFVGEQQWRQGGVPVGGLATGNRQVEFRPVPGYLQPLREPVSVVSGQPATVIEREYFPGVPSTPGSLSITLLPAGIGSAAQWRLLGEDDSSWRVSGATLGGLAAGVYLIEFREVDGYSTPRPLSVTLLASETKSASTTYFLADATVGTQPSPISFEEITSGTPGAATYVGQLRSDSGSGTGFVVRQRVVATAAHVVFDDATLSAATGVQWLFQRQQGTYEPVPQTPRGSYILSGYAAQRALDNNPGASSAASQNLDVAAVWFFEEDAGRDGFGGYLASDSLVNEWLVSDRLKTLVGYPLEDISAGNQGRIHATAAADVNFTLANARVYLTDDITSKAGNSGGPLSVQYDDGRYYPAAIYLGGTSQTRVRAIDSDVITLFDSAEESSNTGQNSTNGGVLQVNASTAAPSSGTLTVTLNPAEARTAGAGWRIGSGSFLDSGQSRAFLSAGSYEVSFRSIAGYRTPSIRSTVVAGGSTTTLVVEYSSALPPVITGPVLVRLIRGEPASFNLTADNDPTTFSTSGLADSGLSLNSSTGEITGTPTENGTISVTATASNDSGTSAPFSISVIVADPGSLSVNADPTRGSVVVKPKRSGNIFPQGEQITLTAKPNKPDFVFAGWEFAGLEGSPSTTTDARTTFTMTSSVVATAHFLPNPFPDRKGTFHSLLTAPDGSAAGILSLKLTANGRFTLRATIGSAKYRLIGEFNGTGAFVGEITQNGASPIPVSLLLNVTATEPDISGTITIDGEELSISGGRSAGSRNGPAPEAGRYTLALAQDAAKTDPTTYPFGFGYAAIKVSETGAIRATGRLADGRVLSIGGGVTANHTWPVFQQPYENGGVLAGTLMFEFSAVDASVRERIVGQLRWEKPADNSDRYASGFTGIIEVDGSPYSNLKRQAAFPIDSWDLQIGENVLDPVVSAKVSLDDRNRFAIESEQDIRLTLDAETGVLKGSFSDSLGIKAEIRGVLLQQQNAAVGYTLLPESSGPITILPPAPVVQ